MPTRIEERNGQYCVVDDAGTTHGCHDSQDDAVGQMLAINEAKGDKSFTERLAELFREKTRKGLLLHKGADGLLHWVAIYSNSFRDDDFPVKEILSAESHQLFEKAVDMGLVPPPALWIFHEKDWEIGKGTWVSTWQHPQKESVVFALSGGYIYEGLEDVAEAIANMPVVKVSHGMYRDSVVRDPDDPSVIRFYISKEVSVLPGGPEANHLTGFSIEKDSEMSKSTKRDQIGETGFPVDLLDKAEEFAAQLAEAGITIETESLKTIIKSAAGIEEDADVEDVEGEDADGDVDTDDKSKTEDDNAGDGIDIAEVSKSVETSLAGILSLQERLNDLEKSLVQRVDAIEKSVLSLQKADDEKVADKARMTPMASMAALVNKSIVGRDAAKVDGRTTLGRSAPTQNENGSAAKGGPTPFPNVNGFIMGGKDNE